MDDRKEISFIDLGLIPYVEAWDLQKKMRAERQEGVIGDTILFCEHPPVFTVGKQDCAEDWLSSNEAIKKEGIEIVKTDRGGRITYHGPGQQVVYFIIDIKNYSTGVRDFVARIEDFCLKLVKSFGLQGSRNTEHPGIWIGEKKIVAIGLHVSAGVSMHGIAINVHPNMSHFRHIIPCGIKGREVTSMEVEMKGKHPTTNDVRSRFSAIWNGWSNY